MYTSDHDGDSNAEWNDEIYVEGYHSDYANSDDELLTPTYTDSDGEKIRNIHKGTSYDPRCSIEIIEFYVGMKFESSSQFTTFVKNYDVWNGFKNRFLRSKGKKVEVVCDKHCPWRIYASLDDMNEAFVIKLLNDDHRCSRTPRNRQASSTWIANNLLEKF